MRDKFVTMYGVVMVALAVFAPGATAAVKSAVRQEEKTMMRGKVNTAKTITLGKTVNASPDEVFAWWTTDVGVKRIFGAAAKIEPRVGGAYTIIFDPAKDPEGNSYGTNGARILRFERPGKLSFEWVTFTDEGKPGTGGPPAVPAKMRNVRPLPTWVELEFISVPGDPMKTRVTLNHYGFQSGAKWDGAYAFMSKMWAGVLEKLAEIAEEPRVAVDGDVMLVTRGDTVSAENIQDNVIPSKIDGFMWMAGKWVGTAGQSETEQVCTAPSRGMMMCMFRVMDSTKVEGLEFSTLRETPNGLEERIRFYSPDLGETAGDNGVTLRVAKYGEREIVYDNVKPDGVVKHVTITRSGEDEFSTRIEVVNAEGKTSFIGATWRRGK
jgi:uncharacterized protein YndB with AHSA1/START domain